MYWAVLHYQYRIGWVLNSFPKWIDYWNKCNLFHLSFSKFVFKLQFSWTKFSWWKGVNSCFIFTSIAKSTILNNCILSYAISFSGNYAFISLLINLRWRFFWIDQCASIDNQRNHFMAFFPFFTAVAVCKFFLQFTLPTPVAVEGYCIETI